LGREEEAASSGVSFALETELPPLCSGHASLASLSLRVAKAPDAFLNLETSYPAKWRLMDRR
jgi:hypothetical protein